MPCSKSSHRGRVRNYYLFALDVNGNAVVIGGARNDHLKGPQVTGRGRALSTLPISFSFPGKQTQSLVP